MYNKETSFKIINYNLYDDMLFKTASEGILPEPYDKDFLYVLVRAISAGEYYGSNKNADFFAEKELRESYHTFLDARVFKNHENKDVAKAIGSIISANWNNVMKYVELLIKIDRELAPTIVRGFEKGYTTDVSMGCRVKHTVCSICGNVAKTRAEFCSHVRTQRNQVLADGRKVFEYNIGPRFHDLSVVLNGADRTAKAIQILTPADVHGVQKAASAISFPEDSLIKCASDTSREVTASTNDFEPERGMKKLADFQKEIIDKLYVLAILSRIDKNNLSEEDVNLILEDAKEASIPLHLGLSKEAGLSRDFKNLAIGGTGIALATNYYQGKRLRGEELNSFQHFIADNPGTLPLAYVLMGYPAYRKLQGKLPAIKSKGKDLLAKAKPKADEAVSKVKETSSGLLKKMSADHSLFFSKAANTSDVGVVDGLDIFTDPRIADMYKRAYHVTDEQLSMVKLALTLYQAGQEHLVDNIKEKYALTDEHLDGFLKTSSEVISNYLEKEASLARGVLEANILNANNPRIPTGTSGPILVGSLLDGFLIHKLFYNKSDPMNAAKRVERTTNIGEKAVKPILDINKKQ